MPMKRKAAPAAKVKKPPRSQAPALSILVPLPWQQVVKLYPSLAKGPKPHERLAKLLAEAEARGVKPMSAEELDRWLEEGRAIWPDDGELDEFVEWVHRCRRQGWYD